MEKDTILDVLKQTFTQVIPAQDNRTKLPHLEFVSGFIFCFIGDTNVRKNKVARLL